MLQFYMGDYGDDMGNAVNKEYSLSEWKTKIKEHIEQEYGYNLNCCPAVFVLSRFQRIIFRTIIYANALIYLDISEHE